MLGSGGSSNFLIRVCYFWKFPLSLGPGEYKGGWLVLKDDY